jgi:hypothetical protein
MKHLLLFFAIVSITFSSSCSSQQGIVQAVGSVLPVQEATVLAEAMATKLGLNALQKSSVYTALLNYNNGKNDLLNKLKSNAITQAAYNIAESALNAQKNNAIKAVMGNSTQLAALGQLFGIK